MRDKYTIADAGNYTHSGKWNVCSTVGILFHIAVQGGRVDKLLSQITQVLHSIYKSRIFEWLH